MNNQIRGHKFVDHPADIQVHSWGQQFAEALEEQALALFEIMFDVSKFKSEETRLVSIKANNLLELTCEFLNEWLYVSDVEDFVLKKIKITKCDLANFCVEAVGYGEAFDMSRHANFRGTEVKAITYGSLKVDEKPGKSELFVLYDL